MKFKKKLQDERQWNKTVQDGICKYFAEDQNSEKLTVFTVNELNAALAEFTDRGDNQTFENLVQYVNAHFYIIIHFL